MCIRDSNCDVSYWVKWEDEDHEPEHCPFCGADATINEEDAIFDDEDEDKDDWN